MKNKITSISFILLLCFVYSGCDGFFADKRYDMTFKNDADYSISIYSLLIPPINSTDPIVYPDTSLPFQEPSLNIKEIRPHDFIIYSSTAVDIPTRYGRRNTDTISFYVFSTDSLDLLGWDSLRSSYNILQRYDISINEYISLYNNLTWDFPCFPPCKEMRDIKMWPPYGTYDSTGHRIN